MMNSRRLALKLSCIAWLWSCSTSQDVNPPIADVMNDTMVAETFVPPQDIATPPPSCTRVLEAEVEALDDSRWTFTLDSHVNSALVFARSPNNELVAVDGLVVEDQTWVETGWHTGDGAALYLRCCVRIAAWPGMALASLPSNPLREVPAGRWTVTLGDKLEAPTVHVRYGEPEGTLKLPVVLHRPIAEPAVEVSAYVDEASAVLSEAADITIDVIEVLEHSFSELGASTLGDFPAALLDERKAVHVVLVPSLEGGIRGLSPVGGPLVGGTVLLAYQPGGNPRTLAHELSHFLGLWHLTEAVQSDIHDPLPDTPHYDSENLMSAMPDGGTSLTQQQAELVRRHPLLQGAENVCAK